MKRSRRGCEPAGRSRRVVGSQTSEPFACSAPTTCPVVGSVVGDDCAAEAPFLGVRDQMTRATRCVVGQSCARRTEGIIRGWLSGMARNVAMTSETIFRAFRPSDAERTDRSAGDRLRHRQKVRESIRENIADIIAEESIIGKNQDRVIKVPLRGIKEYRFVYGDNAPGVGQGDGDAQPGQVVGKTGRDGQGQGDGEGRRPSRRRLLRDRRHARRADRDHVRGSRAAGPRTQAAARDRTPTRFTKRKGYRHVGIRVRLDKRRTARQRVKRMLAHATSPRTRARRQATADGQRAPLPVPSGRPALQASSRPTCARSPTPSSSASWTPRARWTR